MTSVNPIIDGAKYSFSIRMNKKHLLDQIALCPYLAESWFKDGLNSLPSYTVEVWIEFGSLMSYHDLTKASSVLNSVMEDNKLLYYILLH